MGERGGLGRALALAGLGHETQARSAAREDLPAAAFVAVQVQRALLDPVPQRVAKVLLAVIRAAVESERRLLVEVLELLGAQPAALREAAGDPQLPRLPFARGSDRPAAEPNARCRARTAAQG